MIGNNLDLGVRVRRCKRHAGNLLKRAMTSDLDIWRAAGLLIKRHGQDAALVAAQRADELLARGDTEGQTVWKRIARACEELRRGEPREDELIASNARRAQGAKLLDASQ